MPSTKCRSRARSQEAVPGQLDMFRAEQSTNVAFDQNSDLVLDRFGLSEQTLCDGEGLQTTRIADVVDVGVGE